MNRDRDNRGRFLRAAKRQSTQAYTSPAFSANQWGRAPVLKRPEDYPDNLRKRNCGDSKDKTTVHHSRGQYKIPDNRSFKTGFQSSSQDNRYARKLPPPPSSPPPIPNSTKIFNPSTPDMSSSSANGDNSLEKRNNELNLNSSKPNSPKEKDKSEIQDSGKVDDSPLTAATLEAVIAKSMSKVYSKLDTLSQDLKKVQAQQATTNKLAGELKQVQQEVKRIDDTVRAIHKNSLDNSSRHDALVEEVCTIQANVRDHSSSAKTSDDMEILKLKALSLQNNLIIEGIPELSEISEEEAKTILTTDDQVISFLDKILGISKLDIDSMYRLGKPRQDPSSARPILVKFQRPRDRESVWRARSLLNNKANSKYRIKEDLPPQLRPQMAALLKVAQHARRYPKSYRNVMVRDFKVYVNGYGYSADQLENLPKKLRPSYVSTPGNLEAVAFYGRLSIFSNHYICNFMVGKQSLTP